MTRPAPEPAAPGGTTTRTRRPWLGAAAALFAVGWGANQFSSLLLSYRLHTHVSETTVDALFGVYAVGLIPALLLGGPLSDRHGRRLVVPVVALSACATGVLMLGAGVGLPALYAGRFLGGVVSGLAFAPGTAWVKELSSPPWGEARDSQVGARRAAIALSAGFGSGPLVAGAIAQWAPAPTILPYLPHLLVVAAVARTLLHAPETVTPTSSRIRPSPHEWEPVATVDVDAARRAGRQRFARMAGPMAPWVFGAASVSFAVLPAQVTRHTGSNQVVFAAGVAGLTLLVGVVVQPWARRVDARSEAWGMAAGLGLVTAGMLVGALASRTGQPLVVLPAAALLGAGYGTCLVSGLLEVQRVAPARSLATYTAVFYALTYVGFATPVVLSLLTHVAAVSTLLLVLAGLAAATLAAVAAAPKR